MKRLVCILILTSLLSCMDENPEMSPVFDMMDFWDSHHQQSWNLQTTHEKLQGSWKWIFNFCCTESYNAQAKFTTSDNIKITFANTTVALYKGGELIQTSTWSLKQLDGDLFGLQVEPPISQLNGRILSSGNLVLSNNSYLDGEDNFFIQEK